MTYDERARSLVGSRFRPQGRAAEYGLDCLGLIALAYRIPPDLVPANYRLRGQHPGALIDGLSAHFRPVAKSRLRSGDLLLCQAGRGQLHLAVKTACGFIHADVRHGVVETPGDTPWPILRVFRRRREG